jgi:polyhydroxybutyrate depolymerase
VSQPSRTVIERFDDLRAGVFRRTFLLHVPNALSPARVPLVIALHGAFSSGAELEADSGFSRLADREGFLVAYPEGYGFFGLLRHWNSGHCCGPARLTRTDDVGFIDRVIARVRERFPVDESRVFVVGLSNGGMLAHRYAAERSDVVAAVAVVSGTIGGAAATGEPVWQIPAPARPVPILIIHGSADDRIPYDGTVAAGASGRTWLAVGDAVALWRANNHAEQVVASRTDGAVEYRGWTGEASVDLYTIAGGTHRWPPAEPSGGFDATATIWRFFVEKGRHAGVRAASAPSVEPSLGTPDRGPPN